MRTRDEIVETETGTPSGEGFHRENTGSVTCGVCNRFLGPEPGGRVRHVSCDECAGLLLALAS